MKYISTSALSKEINMSSKDLFIFFNEKGWIYKKDGDWNLSKEGSIAGGKTQYTPKFGEYIVWPSNIDINQNVNKDDSLSSTLIGKEFKLSAIKVNALISELGWIEKSNVGGWNITRFGKKQGGVEMTSSSGIPYVIWNKSILTNKSFNRSINGVKEENIIEKLSNSESDKTDEFRLKYPATYRTVDGHRVRSRAEVIIDDYLYHNGITHAYERRLPLEDEDVLSDFYIPGGNVFIEFWGIEENKQYQERKKKKLEVYAREGFQLIELNNSDIESLDDVLPRKLRSYGIKVN